MTAEVTKPIEPTESELKLQATINALQEEVEKSKHEYRSQTPPNLIPRLGEFPSNTAYFTSTTIVHEHEIDGDSQEISGALTVPCMKVTSDAFENGFATPHSGRRYTHQQVWKSKGISLGNLLHSLTLAPGEATRVAVQDWTSTQTGNSQEATEQNEAAASDNKENRAINEIQNSTARETLSGSSRNQANSNSSSAGMSIFIMSAGGASSDTFATSVNSSSGERDIAASESQQIQQNTEKAAETARTRRASVIREVGQSDTSTATTRIVANYNHMHALTMMYYEVLEVYEVTTTAIKRQDCLFLPLQMLSSQTLMDEHSQIISKAAKVIGLDILSAAIDTRAKNYFATKDLPEHHALIGQAKSAIGNSMGTLNSIRPDLSDLSAEEQTLWATYRTSHLSMLTSFYTQINEISTMLNNVVSTGTQIDAAIDEVSNATNLINVLKADTTGNALTVSNMHGSMLMLLDPKNLNGFSVPARRQIETYARNGVAATDTAIQRLQDSLNFLKNARQQMVSTQTTLTELIPKLDLFSEYFNQAVWSQTLTPAAVHAMLKNKKYNEKALNSIIDPKPIAMTGNLVGFALNNSTKMDKTDGPTPIVSTVVVPTGGVFAEAVLGQSVAAEKIDLTRFWNWQDSPIPLTPSEISPISTDHNIAAMDLNAKDFSAFQANLQASMDMPNPTGLSAMLETLAKGDMFKDMDGREVAQSLAEAVSKYASEGNTTSQTLAASNFQKSLDFTQGMYTASKGAPSVTEKGGAIGLAQAKKAAGLDTSKPAPTKASGAAATPAKVLDAKIAKVKQELLAVIEQRKEIKTPQQIDSALLQILSQQKAPSDKKNESKKSDVIKTEGEVKTSKPE